MSSAIHALPVEYEPVQAQGIFRMNIYEGEEIAGYGTGWLTKNVDGKIVMVTNAHVCGSADDTYTVKTDDRRTLIKLSYNPFDDLCVLAFPEVTDAEAANALTIAAEPGKHSEPVYVIGHPKAGPRKTTRGYVIGDTFSPMDIFPMAEVPPSKQYLCIPLGDECLFLRWSQTLKVEIHPGSSGSPVLNAQGQVIAVIWGYNSLSGESIAVKHDALKAALGF
jgi:S1-C subfamily serine protease